MNIEKAMNSNLSFFYINVIINLVRVTKGNKMAKEIIMKVVLTLVGSIVTGLIGYLIAKIKEYKNKLNKKTENEKVQNLALQALLKSQLTNVYFVYSELKQIPDYAYQNFLDLLKVYESLDGDGFIHSIAKKMENWEIVKTDIL